MNNNLVETMRRKVYCPMSFNAEEGAECYETWKENWECAWWDQEENCCCVKSYKNIKEVKEEMVDMVAFGLVMVGGFSLLTITLLALCNWACRHIYEEKPVKWHLERKNGKEKE